MASPCQDSIGGSGSRTWSSVTRWTVFGTLGCVLVSVGFNALLFENLGGAALQRAMISATVLPIFLGVPLLFLLSLRLRRLAIANRRLGMVARTDSLTSCLNRGAFTAQVTTQLARAGSTPGGALLVIDADNFKSINDRFGHDAGDLALTVIARAIRSVLRAGDLVGRMGGEEFGVFLPGVDADITRAIAERIRSAVNEAEFVPRGTVQALSVSIGGAVFGSAIGFSELFRVADQRLYDAKQTGRNRVTIVAADQFFPQALQRA
ncbi:MULTISPECIES: GGDEF domain-containing protein [unclassified Devosia]|uniref:GGDEF domain-containing protein n=1 Tax=unclassified Devosia TaxID=196773 RepID=UPI00155721DE|nr:MULTISPECIES: GGDEF domain-containing protein [unclassified Devosia]